MYTTLTIEREREKERERERERVLKQLLITNVLNDTHV